MDDISWGSIHFDDEVRDWISRLPEGDYGRVEFYLGLLAALSGFAKRFTNTRLTREIEHGQTRNFGEHQARTWLKP